MLFSYETMDEVLRPVRILSTISTMKGTRNKIRYFCMGTLLTLVTVSAILRQIVRSINDEGKGIIVASVKYGHYNLRVATTVCCLIMTSQKSHCIDNFIMAVRRLDKKFQAMGSSTDYDVIKRLTRKLVVYVIFKVVLQQIPFYLRGDPWDLVAYLDYIVFNVPIFFIHVLLAQWITYLSILRLSFKTLNATLKTFRYRQCWVIEDFRKFRNSSNKTIPQREILRTCGLIYDDLFIQGEQINEAYAWQILFLIPTLFVITIYNSFQTCRMIKNQIEFDCGWMIFDILYFSLFLELVIPCVTVSKEADKFADVLHNINTIESDDIINCLILQVHHQKIEFSARGVFALDGTLIYSVLGALTTYLVILLQFDL